MSQANGQDFGKQSKESAGAPSSQIDFYHKVVQAAATDDEFLSANNLGLGNYDSSEYWQQIEAYRKTLFADAAFGRRIIDRAISQTQRALAEEEWEELPESTQKSKSRRRYLRERGEEIWDDELTDDQRIEQLRDVTGLTRDWTPPFFRMLLARHEASRSKGARLMDNAFGRVSENHQELDAEAAERFEKLGAVPGRHK
jgi:hypothetical protein